MKTLITDADFRRVGFRIPDALYERAEYYRRSADLRSLSDVVAAALERLLNEEGF